MRSCASTVRLRISQALSTGMPAGSPVSGNAWK